MLSSRVRSLAWPGIATVATGLVVVLAVRKQRLDDLPTNLAMRITRPYRGFVVPAVSVVDLSGDSVVLGESDSGSVQLLFVFRAECEQCRASLTAWNTLDQEFHTNPQVQVIGVSLDSTSATRAYAESHGLAFRTVSLTAPRMQALWRTQLVPQTELVDPLGRVWYARIGTLADSPAVDSVRAAAAAAVNSASRARADTATMGTVSR